MSDSNTDIFEQCVSDVGDDASDRDLLRCISSVLQDQALEGYQDNAGNSFLLVISASMIFFMQAGFAMLCAGAVRRKNVGNTMLKNLLDACGASVAFFAFGYAFSFGSADPDSTKTTFIGNSNFFLVGVSDLAFWLFQFAFSAASATIVAGTLAERCQMIAYLAYSFVLVGFVYPVVVHSLWSDHGFLSPHNADPLWGTGVIDFAGSGVVHLTGGTTALFAAVILGPRRGRFHDETGRRLETPKEFPGHSIALQMLGVFILWFGWYGFNAGSALTLDIKDKFQVAALAAVNTTLSGGTAGLVALFANLIILERKTGEVHFDLKFAMNGTLGGMVAITGGCGVVEPWAGLVTGFIAGLLYMVGSHALLKFQVDDAVDAIPVHLVNGMWGLLAVGLFASPSRLEAAYENSKHAGWFYSLTRGSGDATLLGTQIIGVLFVFGWVMTIMFPFFIWLNYKGWFRSDPLEEIVGLDVSYHGGLVLGDSDAQPEYITAFNKLKLDNAKKNLSKRLDTGSTTPMGSRPESEAPAFADALEDEEGRIMGSHAY